jgi:predicted transposase YbfD/YdcC
VAGQRRHDVQKGASAQTATQGEAEMECHISSLLADAERNLATTRSHWGVGDRLHWSLDLSFREDKCRVRNGHRAQKLAIMRQFALNLLKRDRTVKAGVGAKRNKSGWEGSYLIHVLGQ